LAVTIYFAWPGVGKQLGSSLSPSNLGCLARLEWSQCIPRSADQAQAVEYVRANTSPGEKLYVGLLRHDLIFANDALFYFLAERDSATRYHELHPGVATTRPVQEEIVSDLEQASVPYVVLFSRYENRREPNESSVSSGVTLLDDYIRDHYRQVEQFGDYMVWERK
jgi:hypothetical protein